MSDIIQLLPDSVANQIAAGEVIQRPASVIKELVENAVDAKATTINVIIVDAGRTSIQVIDNGVGMSDTDARLSFERHATSKIRKADDLFSLSTMGFRGEALASIAAVAQVELNTRARGEELGTHISISGSKITLQEPVSCSEGSNFNIENLFFNVPARRKFLKSNSTELNNIMTAFERIVLVYPQVNFTLHSNGVELFNLRASGLRQRIIDVFGKKLNQDLLPVGVETTMCKISGYVGRPESARKKGARQFFFVNGRYMKHPYFNKAVMNAFERILPQGEQVPYFIYFDIAPDNIDVNIHPTKTEIKFENEQAIWQILSASVKDAVGKFNDVPSIDFDTQGRPEIPVFNPDAHTQAPRVNYNPQYNPFESFPTEEKQTVPDQWEQLYEGLKKKDVDDEALNIFDGSDDHKGDNVFAEKSPAHYQYKGKYIMTAVKSGLMIIDQYRAHVRILYEEKMQQLRNHIGNSQKILFPEVVRLSPSDVVVLDKIMGEMTEMGFELTDLGGNSYAVNAIPSGLEGLNVEKLVRDMVSAAEDKDASVCDEINQSLALSLARNAAIPQGQILSNEEMENIVNKLFACTNANYTPDGKTILCIVQQTEIELLFA